MTLSNPKGALVLIGPKGEEYTHENLMWTTPPDYTVGTREYEEIAKEVFQQWSYNAKTVIYKSTSEGYQGSFETSYSMFSANPYTQALATNHPFPANVFLTDPVNALTLVTSSGAGESERVFSHPNGSVHVGGFPKVFLHRDLCYWEMPTRYQDLSSDSEFLVSQSRVLTDSKMTLSTVIDYSSTPNEFRQNFVVSYEITQTFY